LGLPKGTLVFDGFPKGLRKRSSKDVDGCHGFCPGEPGDQVWLLILILGIALPLLSVMSDGRLPRRVMERRSAADLIK
jgi:hypothetical protein